MSDPVEDGVRRWVWEQDGVRRWEISVPTQWKWPDPQGEWVTYSDHVAAVQAERERIRAGVEALPDAMRRGEWRNAVLTVIDGGSDA